jgi:ABC-2 type transport system permease protein/oleandomycin transport system permease protein
MSALAQPIAGAAATRHGRLYWAIADTLTMSRRHLLHIPQQPEQWISATIQPIMFVLLFRYVFGGAIQIPGVSYVNYMMAGIFVQTIVIEGMTGGIGLALDLKQGVMDRFRALPMSPVAVLLGPILSDLVRNVFIIGVMVSIGLAVGFRPDADPLALLGALGVLLAASFAVSWIGSVVALIARDPEAVQMGGFIVLFPLTFASSAFVPVESMPSWLQPFVRHQPVSVIISAVRSFVLDQPAASSSWQALAWCAVIVAICVPVSVALFRRIGQA